MHFVFPFVAILFSNLFLGAAGLRVRERTDATNAATRRPERNSVVRMQVVSLDDPDDLLDTSLNNFRQTATPPDRLMYSRMSKTGGSVTTEFIEAILPEEKRSYADEANGVLEALARRSESREKTFVIGTIRDPCEIYVSNWAMLSENYVKKPYVVKENYGKHFEHCFGEDANLSGMNTTDKFSGPEDIARFRAWVRSPEVQAMVSYRFWWKYLGGHQFGQCTLCGPLRCAGTETSRFKQQLDGKWPTERLADCWVHTSSLYTDLRKCLREFEAKGGSGIDWIRFEDLVQRHGINRSPHTSCSMYYDKETSLAVRTGWDKPIFEKFGFDTCCGV